MRAVGVDWEDQPRRKVTKKVRSKASQWGGLSPCLGQAATGSGARRAPRAALAQASGLRENPWRNTCFDG